MAAHGKQIDKAIENTDHEKDSKKIDNETFSAKWTRAVDKIRHFVNRKIQWIAKQAATNPKTCVAIAFTASVLMVAFGLLTNFNMDAMNEESWLPIGSRSAIHRQWINEESGFFNMQRNVLFNIHANGENIAGIEGAKRAFQVVDAVRSLPRYDEFCAPGAVEEDKFADGCPLWGVTQFWHHNMSYFDSMVHTNEEAKTAVSAMMFPNGQYVHATSVLGNVGILYGTVVFVQSYPIVLVLPEVPGIKDFELEVIDTALQLEEEWQQDSMFHVEVFTPRSVPDELMRGVVKDIPLFPVCFVLMSLFACVAFYRRDPVKSRTVLGVGAVISVFLAIMLAYGLMFCIGVPLSQMTQLLPFILFGIGLDDVFIIIGAYTRTDPEKDPVQRIDETMEDVGSSIFLTTLTSTLAFAFGAVSSVPIVRGLCHYAYLSIICIFLLQITFFVALIVLDEQRIQSNRRDCCACCIVGTAASASNEIDENEDGKADQSTTNTAQVHIADRIMTWYAKQLTRKTSQITVLVVFGAFFVSMCYSVTQLRQEFDFTEVLPMDSYLVDFFVAATDYSQQTSVYPAVYFRCVDQSNEDIQRQMEQYVDELVALDEVEDPPPLFWLRDFKEVVERGELHDLSFNEQLDIFLDIPIFKELYSRDIVRDAETGNIIASRTFVDMNNVDQRMVDDTIKALEHQREVALNQPINTPEGISDRTMFDPVCEDPDNWAFFMFEAQFQTWEFYTIAVPELLFSAVVGIAAVTVVGILLIPHWTTVLFLFPLITITYIDLLGLLQFLGSKINALTYVSMVMSIGLMVDFIVHVLLRYYECEGDKTRRERVVETLGTMGASVVLGGTSSFLGVLPLSISSTLIVQTIFINFISLVVVGLTHGLILVPVVLSLLGPTDIVTHSKDEQQHSNNKEKISHGTNDINEAAGSRSSDSFLGGNVEVSSPRVRTETIDTVSVFTEVTGTSATDAVERGVRRASLSNSLGADSHHGSTRNNNRMVIEEVTMSCDASADSLPTIGADSEHPSLLPSSLPSSLDKHKAVFEQVASASDVEFSMQL